MGASHPARAHSPRRLTITRREEGGVLVLAVGGEIDEDTGTQFRQELLPDGGRPAPYTVVDLTRVTFMDSTGINVLITAHHALPDGGWLRLAGATGIVWRVIELVSLHQAIPCFPTVQQALHA
ncbi:anti-sigma factor antagonist [Streptomyces sp. NPDC008150]|uniref:STAS domain-containing protein n=1 Tax=Streptomyces sp. NPDC008150 TaxID=3364816 RepID=UPI0036EBF23C